MFSYFRKIRKIKRSHIAFLFIIILWGCGGEQKKIPQAQNAQNNAFEIRNHIVYLSTNYTENIPDDVAEKFRIEKNKNNIVLNVSIFKKSNNKPTKANISVKANNLLGQSKKIQSFEIIENGNTSYAYLSSISDQETLNYNIAINLEDNISSTLKYSNKFYIE